MPEPAPAAGRKAAERGAALAKAKTDAVDAKAGVAERAKRHEAESRSKDKARAAAKREAARLRSAEHSETPTARLGRERAATVVQARVRGVGGRKRAAAARAAGAVEEARQSARRAAMDAMDQQVRKPPSRRRNWPNCIPS